MDKATLSAIEWLCTLVGAMVLWALIAYAAGSAAMWVFEWLLRWIRNRKRGDSDGAARS